jgi:O-antigen/teichoic acid export membrane protein
MRFHKRIDPPIERGFPSIGECPPGLDIRGTLLARGALFNLFGQGIPLIIGLASIPFVIKSLGTDRFGILSLVWVAFGYFGIFDFGLGPATTKFVAQMMGSGERHRIPHFLWTTVLFQLILGLAGGLLFFLSTPLLLKHVLNIPPEFLREANMSFVLMAFSLPLAFVSSSFRGSLEAAQRFDLVNFIKVITSAASYLLPVFGALIGFKLPGIICLLIGSRILTFIAWVTLNFRVFPELRCRPSIHKDSVVPLLKFGGWVTVSNTINPLLIYVDRFLIGSLITVSAVSYYTAPYEALSRIGFIPGSLITTLFPAFSALRGGANDQKMKVLFARSVKYVMLAMGPLTVGLVLFAKDILAIWLGMNFASKSTLVFQILAFGFFLNSLANIPMGFLLGSGRSDIPAKFHLFEVMLYVPLCWALIKALGIRGAAIAWAIRVTLDMALLFVGAGRIGILKMSEWIREGMAQATFAILALAAAGAIVGGFSWRVFGFIVIMSGFLPVVWFYALTQVERDWILKLRTFIPSGKVL